MAYVEEHKEMVEMLDILIYNSIENEGTDTGELVGTFTQMECGTPGGKIYIIVDGVIAQ